MRNGLKRSFAGRVVLQIAGREPPMGKLRVISATRMTEGNFWRKSALGKSIATWQKDSSVSVHVRFENTAGLPAVYNAAMNEAGPNDVLLFVHDDIWLDDPQWIQKIKVALGRFDVVGLAGCTRRVPNQPAWLFDSIKDGGGFVSNAPYQSGAVAHGRHPKGFNSAFGPTPARCELLDGVFLVARKNVLARSGVQFDERFMFHFYDMDFCRTARAAGLSLGTWPIALTHQSTGAFGSPAWYESLQRYRDKWGD